MTAQTDKGQATAKTAAVLVVGLMIFGVLAAVMLPVAINEIEGNTTTSVGNQAVDTTFEINSQLDGNITAITDGTDATVLLNDTRTSGTTSKTINVGDDADYSMYDGQTVTVGVESATSGSPNTASINATYSNDYTYGDAARSLWGLLGLAIVLAALLFVVAIALRFNNGM